jgi:hypothetical protein
MSESQVPNMDRLKIVGGPCWVEVFLNGQEIKRLTCLKMEIPPGEGSSPLLRVSLEFLAEVEIDVLLSEAERSGRRLELSLPAPMRHTEKPCQPG